jgi:hypothetical protein
MDILSAPSADFAVPRCGLLPSPPSVPASFSPRWRAFGSQPGSRRPQGTPTAVLVAAAHGDWAFLEPPRPIFFCRGPSAASLGRSSGRNGAKPPPPRRGYRPACDKTEGLAAAPVARQTAWGGRMSAYPIAVFTAQGRVGQLSAIGLNRSRGRLPGARVATRY